MNWKHMQRVIACFSFLVMQRAAVRLTLPGASCMPPSLARMARLFSISIELTIPPVRLMPSPLARLHHPETDCKHALKQGKNMIPKFIRYQRAIINSRRADLSDGVVWRASRLPCCHLPWIATLPGEIRVAGESALTIRSAGVS